MGAGTSGATAEVIGGRVSDIDAASNSSAASVVHLGVNGLTSFTGNTVTTLATGVSDISLPVVGMTDTLIDEQHGVTLGYKSLEVYHPGSLYATDGIAVAPAIRNNSSTPTDLTGTVTLDGLGHGTYTFQSTYSSGNPPACGCWDAQDTTKGCAVSVSNTGLSFTGTALHPAAFICAGHN
jgi:hypothetical protein